MGANADIGEKDREVVPLLADSDAAPAVVFEVLAVGVEASLPHALPDGIQRVASAAGVSVRSALPASTRPLLTAQVRASDKRHRPAVASAQPYFDAEFIDTDGLDRDKTTKAKPGNVFVPAHSEQSDITRNDKQQTYTTNRETRRKHLQTALEKYKAGHRPGGKHV